MDEIKDAGEMLSAVNAFDVFSFMVNTDNKKLKLAPIGNITHMRRVKAGTQVTIGIEGDVLSQIYDGTLVGGLILCEKEEFETLKRKLMYESPTK